MADTVDQTRAGWEQIAARYDERVTPTHFAIAHPGLQQVGLAPGMRLLDVAASQHGVMLPSRKGFESVLTTGSSLSPRGHRRANPGER